MSDKTRGCRHVPWSQRPGGIHAISEIVYQTGARTSHAVYTARGGNVAPSSLCRRSLIGKAKQVVLLISIHRGAAGPPGGGPTPPHLERGLQDPDSKHNRTMRLIHRGV